MTCDVAHPQAAVLAGALALLALFAVAAHRRRGVRWRLAGILLPLGAAVMVALAVAGPSIGADGRVTILLDFSPSARNAPWHDDPEWVRQVALKHLPPRQRVTVMAFDGSHQQTLRYDTTLEDPWGGGFAYPVVGTPIRPSPRTPEWLFTDGLSPAPHDLPAAVTIVRSRDIDIGVRDMVVRAASSGGVEVLAQVRAVAWQGTGPRLPEKMPVEVVVRRDQVEIARQVVEFARPKSGRALDDFRWISIHDGLAPVEAAPSQAYTVTATLTPKPDMWPENDMASIIFPGLADVPRVLTLSNTLPVSPTTLRADQFLKSTRQLAAEGWQAAILDDIPAVDFAGESLSAASAQTLDQLVRQTGAGLLIQSRAHAFAPGHYGESPGASNILEDLSPVHSQPHSGASLHVIFVLDTSASMNEAAGSERKITILSSAVGDAVRPLSGDDRLTLITFDSKSQLLGDGPVRDTLPAVRARLAGIEPQGATAPDAALEHLAAALKEDPIPRQIVFFLTDGEISSLDVARWKATLARTHLVVVAPGPVAGTPLRELAAAMPESVWLGTSNPRSWRDLLHGSVLAQLPGKLQSTPLAWHTDAFPNLADTFSAITPSYISTWIKPESQLLAEGSQKEPVAAIVQRGLGKVAAITIPDDNTLAYAALKSELLRQIAAPPGDRRFRAAAARQPDGAWLVTADGTEGETFINHQSLAVKVISAADQVTSADATIEAPTIPLTQTAPGHYEARVSSAGGLTGVITRAGDSPASEQLVARLQTPSLQTTEYPASVDAPWTPAPNGTAPVVLSAAPDNTTLWQVPSAKYDLSIWLWLAAILATLAALWLRQ